ARSLAVRHRRQRRQDPVEVRRRPGGGDHVIERTVPLRRGLNLGASAQTVAVVRSQSVDDALRIAEISNEAKKVAEMVRLRVVNIGEIKGPLSDDQFRRLESDDYTRLQVAIELLD